MRYFKLKSGTKIIIEPVPGICKTGEVLDNSISFEYVKSEGKRFLTPIEPHWLHGVGFEEELFDFGQLSIDF